ncbi:MAG: ABC transporter ATP-binding protein [Eubacteriales bacterium]|nr:ABC transporter ATP-binding protein [Eubacteriales bacterium]
MGRKKESGTKKRRSAPVIMGSLIGLVSPLLHVMVLAVLLGTAGYLCAIFLTILAGWAVLAGIGGTGAAAGLSGLLADVPVSGLFALMAALAVLRGLLHYAEQYCNHFIAFKLLAIIRHKVFSALRRLCPARLEGRERGNLISIITTDIELLEVFYAHTISPIAIAVLTCLIMTGFIGSYHPAAGLLALAAYLTVGVLIPLQNGRRGAEKGMAFRTAFGGLNSFVLDSLRGLDETVQYNRGQEREKELQERSRSLAGMQRGLSRLEGSQRSRTNLAILFFSFAMLFLTLGLQQQGRLGFEGVLLCTLAMMGSFGPVAALSSLSNNLNQTLASGERVLSLLEEEPAVEEVAEPALVCAERRETEADNPDNSGGPDGSDGSGVASRAVQVGFAYGSETILKDFSLEIGRGQILGIHGASGSGKSTFLKLLMRFWDVQEGRIEVDGEDVREIPTGRLRRTEGYVTQETYLFHDSIANNIAVGKPGASREEIVEAAKKASLHDFVCSLPKGYDTPVGELGDTLSGGEKQRIGIARAFLHDAPLLLLDEPTSNLDSLNEGIILKALRREACRGACHGAGQKARKKTVVLVSHRSSTMGAADRVVEMETTVQSSLKPCVYREKSVLNG